MWNIAPMLVLFQGLVRLEKREELNRRRRKVLLCVEVENRGLRRIEALEIKAGRKDERKRENDVSSLFESGTEKGPVQFQRAA